MVEARTVFNPLPLTLQSMSPGGSVLQVRKVGWFGTSIPIFHTIEDGLLFSLLPPLHCLEISDSLLLFHKVLFIFFFTPPPLMGCGAAEGSVCFVVSNPRVLSVNRVDLGFFISLIFQFYSPPPSSRYARCVRSTFPMTPFFKRT